MTRLAQDTQDAVTTAWYERLTGVFGSAVKPIQLAHRALTQHAYFWVHAGLQAAALAARAVSSARASDVGRITEHPRGHATLAVLNGVSGDQLHRQGSALAVPMTLRHAGRDLAATPSGLRTAYGRGHDRLAVFVHGLVENDAAWLYRAGDLWGAPGVSYGSRLQQDLGYLPLWVRYNTGLGVATNGAALGTLLDSVVRAWPRQVEEVVLVGHSMGGLVILSALGGAAPSWPVPVRAAVTLGSPRNGAPLERHAAVAERLAGSVPAATWLRGLVGMRSAGIRDLAHGTAGDLPIPAAVSQYAVLSTLTARPTSALGCRIGDGLVPVPGRHLVETAVLGGLNHLDLLNHPRVYVHLHGWLASSGAAGVAP